MRKMIFIILLLSFFICGCGNMGRRAHISDEMYESAKYVINVAEKFLDGESTIEDTSDKIESVNVPEPKGEEYPLDGMVSNDILGVQINVLGVKLGSSEIADLKDSVEDLKEELGE